MDTQRLEAFSDGVFAIAITLLVLGIEVPPFNSALEEELLRLWPSYLAYAVSFLLIGGIWVNHHAMFRHIVRSDGALLVLNLLQLLVFAFLPFPTAVLAGAFLHGTSEGIASAFYGGTLVFGGLLVNAVWWYAARGGHLLDGYLTVEQASQIGRRYLIGPIVYAIAIIVGVFVPWLALALYILANTFYLWPRRIDEVAMASASALPSRGENAGRRSASRQVPVRRLDGGRRHRH